MLYISSSAFHSLQIHKTTANWPLLSSQLLITKHHSHFPSPLFSILFYFIYFPEQLLHTKNREIPLICRESVGKLKCARIPKIKHINKRPRLQSNLFPNYLYFAHFYVFYSILYSFNFDSRAVISAPTVVLKLFFFPSAETNSRPTLYFIYHSSFHYTAL